MQQSPRQQTGLALITVLMIFAIVALLATSMIERQASDIQRSATLFSMQQARAFTLGAESAVKTGLFLDWKNNAEIDHALEEWAQDRQFPLEPGTAFIRIRDAQGRFNLNWLSKASANRERQLQRFTHLLNLLGLEPELANRLYEWMDAESQADTRYQNAQPAYRAAYQGCVHSSELLLLEGLGMSEYTRLEPYVSCLPMTTSLNVNSASAYVLASLDASLTLADGESMVSARGEKGFTNLDDFWALPVVQPFVQDRPDRKKEQPLWERSDFGVKSEFFEAFIRVDLAERIASSEVLIRRDGGDGRMTTLYRDYARREPRPDTHLIQ